MDYDIVVVGCGPAGSIFSRNAAKAGLRVLAIDRRKAIGEPVRCGEGLGLNDMERNEIKPSDAFCDREIEGAILFPPSGK